MGEYADEYIDRLLFGRGHTRRTTQFDRTCERCGKTGLKWRADEDGWRLYENERVEHNRLKRHECNPPSEDDFDVIG
ncbi:hypothetical protein [Burkholderia glumae]|uniref:hypothetical protein n=1 Tax=Burkholderia glumae TaxID=337 RepID=UPI00157B2E3B|nr:hypothetical protein [Burkholderia glumae]QKM47753.1 hypothetical protein B7760_01777 [Burkholderia glumae]